MTLAAGTKLGTYDILAPIGSGAMGEVYRAKDSRLGREVAIKVLPEHFADDEERLLRFEREAKTLASLNHPNVAQIFGVDQVGDTCFLVLELVPGESLDERLARGPLPLDEALDVCRQIAEGLEAAHEAGVIHRDLKPANVRLTPDGKVKVLDFGLAKPMRVSEETRSTDSVLSTEGGRLLGTPTYMAPEQARGKPIDRRIDVWAFGCVLYECLTGKRAFEGETLSDVLSEVLRSEPDLDALPAATPPRVRALIRRCLDKDSRARLRDVGEARLVLADPGAGEGPATAKRRRFQERTIAALSLLVVVLAAIAFRGGLGGRGEGPPAATLRFSVRVPHGVALLVDTNLNEQSVLAIAPDGASLVYVGKSDDTERLYLRRFDGLETVRLDGTDDASCPFFSPDGRWIGFFARGKLRKVATSGGQPIELCDVGLNRGGVWCPDGSIVFSPTTTSGLWVIPSSGGVAREMTRIDPEKHERTHRWPALLPTGEVAFTVGTVDKPGAYEDSAIEAVTLATGARRTLLTGASMVKAAGDEHLVLARDGQLLALPLADADGGPAQRAVQVLQGVAGLASSGAYYFDVAANGTLVYAESHPRAREYELAWITRDGEIERLPFPPREYATPRVSPDGKLVAVAIGPGSGRASDVWIGDLGSGSLRRLTLDGRSGTPYWNPDGTRVAFSVTGIGDSIAWKAADGGDAPETLFAFEDSVPRAPLGWFDGVGGLLFQQDRGPGLSSDILALSLATGEIRDVAATSAIEFAGTLSPDGRMLAYTSDESGRAEVYVQAFPGPGGRWQVSERGGYPVWSRDGSELFYLDGRKMLAVPCRREPSFAPGAPVELFEAVFRVETETLGNFDVAPDGRFLVVRDTAEESMAHHVNVVLGWDGVVRRLTKRP